MGRFGFATGSRRDAERGHRGASAAIACRAVCTFPYSTSTLPTCRQGETWSVSTAGERYNRWWGFQHTSHEYSLLHSTRQGETWSVSTAGERYNRWWGENHMGDGFVQKFGNSTTGAWAGCFVAAVLVTRAFGSVPPSLSRAFCNPVVSWLPVSCLPSAAATARLGTAEPCIAFTTCHLPLLFCRRALGRD